MEALLCGLKNGLSTNKQFRGNAKRYIENVLETIKISTGTCSLVLVLVLGKAFIDWYYVLILFKG